MALLIGDQTLLAMCNALVDDIDAGVGAGTLKIYTGTQPADPDAVVTDTLLATITFGDPAFGAAAIQTTPDRAEAVCNATTDETSATAGTAGWFLIEDSDGDAVVSGTVTATGGGGDLELSSTTIGAGATVALTEASSTLAVKRAA